RRSEGARRAASARGVDAADRALRRRERPRRARLRLADRAPGPRRRVRPRRGERLRSDGARGARVAAGRGRPGMSAGEPEAIEEAPTRPRGRTTLRDVARLADVHTSTVSRALSEKTRSMVNPDTVERVLAAADHLDYRPNAMARRLKTNRSHSIG